MTGTVTSPLERDTGLPEFVGQTLGINGFEKAGSNVSMHLDRQTNDPIAQVSMGQHTRASCSFVVNLRKNEHARTFHAKRLTGEPLGDRTGLLFPPQELIGS